MTHKINVLGDISPSGFEDDYPNDMTPSRMMKEVAAADGADIEITVHSGGGHGEEGVALYNITKMLDQKVTFVILGQSASAMSLWQMAGDEIVIHESAQIMIHNPWTFTMGSSSDLREHADYLDQLTDRAAAIYSSRSGQSIDSVKSFMDAETWFTAERAVELGFADRIIANKKRADTSASLSRYNNLPAKLSNEIKELPTKLAARKRAERELKIKKARLKSFAKKPLKTAAKMGNALADLFNERIDSMVTEDRSRFDIINSIGGAAEVDTGEIFQVLQGFDDSGTEVVGIQCPSQAIIDGFIEILNIPRETVDQARVSDGCEI